MQELTAIGRLAHGRGGGADDLVGLLAARELDKAAQGQGSALHGVAAQAAVVERAAPHLHHIALTVDHLEALVAAGDGDDHVDGVGADVDGSDAHVRALGSRSRETP